MYNEHPLIQIIINPSKIFSMFCTFYSEKSIVFKLNSFTIIGIRMTFASILLRVRYTD